MTPGLLNKQQPLRPGEFLNQGLVEAWHGLPGGAGSGMGNVGWRGLLGRYTLPLTNMDASNVVGNGGVSSGIGDSVYASWAYNGSDEYMELPYAARLNPSAYTIHAVFNMTTGATGFKALLSTRWVSTGPTSIKGFVQWGRDSTALRPSIWNGDGTAATWDVVDPDSVLANGWYCVTSSYLSPNLRLAVGQKLYGPQTDGQYTLNTQGVLRVGAGKSANDGAGPDAAAALFMQGRIAALRIYERALSVGSMLALNAEAAQGYPRLLNWG